MGRQIAIFGSGGHARETRELAEYCGWVVECFVDLEGGTDIDDLPVRPESTYSGRVMAIGVGSPAVRQQIYGRWAADLEMPVLGHRLAAVSSRAELLEGTTVQAGVFVGPHASLGKGVLVNYGATIGHDSRVGDFCSILPGASLSGKVSIGPGCTIGSRAVILPGVNVGMWSTVGAGAVVTKDVPAHTVVLGIPARVKERR